MKVLLDECIPRKFKKSLPGHECQTVPEAGLAGKTNGELISIAEERGFDVLLTVDKGLGHEPNMAGRRIAILIVRAKSNRLADLLPHASACIAQISSLRHGQIFRVGEKS
jgi:predicted nuclease of predicted toxin-antitoxin system